MDKILSGFGIYAFSWVLCFKPGIFNSFTQYRTFITELSVKPKMDWVFNFAICPLCVSLVLCIPFTFLFEGNFLVNLISLFGVSFVTHIISEKLEESNDDIGNQ